MHSCKAMHSFLHAAPLKVLQAARGCRLQRHACKAMYGFLHASHPHSPFKSCKEGEDAEPPPCRDFHMPHRYCKQQGDAVFQEHHSGCKAAKEGNGFFLYTAAPCNPSGAAKLQGDAQLQSNGWLSACQPPLSAPKLVQRCKAKCGCKVIDVFLHAAARLLQSTEGTHYCKATYSFLHASQPRPPHAGCTAARGRTISPTGVTNQHAVTKQTPCKPTRATRLPPLHPPPCLGVPHPASPCRGRGRWRRRAGRTPAQPARPRGIPPAPAAPPAPPRAAAPAPAAAPRSPPSPPAAPGRWGQRGDTEPAGMSPSPSTTPKCGGSLRTPPALCSGQRRVQPLLRPQQHPWVPTPADSGSQKQIPKTKHPRGEKNRRLLQALDVEINPQEAAEH